jgi:hypothetical protein
MTTKSMEKALEKERDKERASRKGPKTFSIHPDQLVTCPITSLVASHWKEDGTCRCKDIAEEKLSEKRLDSVEKILEGAYAALEMLSEEELKILEQRCATLAGLQQSRKQLGMNQTITLFVRGARETLHPLGKGL